MAKPKKPIKKPVKKLVKKLSKKTVNKLAKKVPVKKISKKTTKARVVGLALKKFKINPILSPRGENWESWQTFNPGVVKLNDKIHFLYRAIGNDGMSRLGYAESDDGYTLDLRLPHPVYEHKVRERSFNVFSYFSGGSWGGAEDPRIVRVGNEDKLHMTYTACNGDLRVGLTSINVDDFLNKKWNWSDPVLISPPGEVHKNWLIFPEKINGKYAVLHSLNPEVRIEYLDNLDFEDGSCIQSSHGGKPRQNCWDKWIRGAGPVPVKTDLGWLLFYHAMDNDWGKYRVGAMLLDSNDPTKIIARSKSPVLEPKEHYENHGFKGGVVYASGAAVKDDNIYIYYGGADSYVCLAYANLERFLDELVKNKEPKLSSKAVRSI